MFPEASGAYIAHRDAKSYIVKIKGVYPTFDLDNRIFDLGEFLNKGKLSEAPKGTAENILLAHEKWSFEPLKFLNFEVFSNTEFRNDNGDLYLSDDDYYRIRGKYYRLVEQGVSAVKIIRALSYEFKVPTERIIELVNCYDREARCWQMIFLFHKG